MLSFCPRKIPNGNLSSWQENSEGEALLALLEAGCFPSLPPKGNPEGNVSPRKANEKENVSFWK